MDQDTLTQLQNRISAAGAFIPNLRNEMGRVIAGQQHLINCMIMALLADGHVLTEGLPGLAKTLAVKTLGKALGGAFSRIQFTPDLLPADVTGTIIYNAAEHQFSVKKGPIFANIVLADEINRAPAKVQSALLEAMQEHQVTIGGETHKLPLPFLVMATQNPIEQEGTYPLPEAQIDRFLFKVTVGYPSREEERQIIERMAHPECKLEAIQICKIEDIFAARAVMDEIYIDEKIMDYILDVVIATRPNEHASLSPRQNDVDLHDVRTWVQIGASPRAPIALTLAAKARAFIEGRAYVVPHDVKSVAPDVLRHRIMLSYEAEAENVQPDQVIAFILNHLRTP